MNEFRKVFTIHNVCCFTYNSKKSNCTTSTSVEKRPILLESSPCIYRPTRPAPCHVYIFNVYSNLVITLMLLMCTTSQFYRDFISIYQNILVLICTYIDMHQ